LLQLAARAAFLAKDFDKVRQLQKRAFKANRVLFQPDEAQYIALKPAGEQAKAIVDGFLKYDLPKAYLAEFGEIESHLTATVSAAQFEEALKGLGRFLGFQSQRPECEFDAGPDVLWIASEHLGFVIEAKSCKQVDNPLTKKEYGQLLTSDKWFHEQYEGYESIKVVVHPNAFADHRVAPGDTMVLTLDTLSVMVARIKETLNCLADSTDLDRETLLVKCNAKLEELNLKPEQLVENYLMPLRKE
jgi:hypothetical protein